MPTEEYPYLYRYSYQDAVADGEEDLWKESFRENVCCARAIEEALRESEIPDDPAQLPPDCIAPALEKYGFKRVNFVLAHTVAETEANPAIRHLISDDVRNWAKGQAVVADATYGNEVGVGKGLKKAIDDGIVSREDVFITSKKLLNN